MPFCVNTTSSPWLASRTSSVNWPSASAIEMCIFCLLFAGSNPCDSIGYLECAHKFLALSQRRDVKLVDILQQFDQSIDRMVNQSFAFFS